ncbi:MAG: uracil-DNA glycosylase [Deltaproteobacteria bacterium]|nr:uracil-DNA glycosylase [Deltaproteobacteria bacterium]
MTSNPKYSAKAAKKDLKEALDDIDSYLRFLAESGCLGFDCSTESLQKIEAWGHKNSPCTETLKDIQMDLGDCSRCKLSGDRKNIVFGVGNPNARLIFVGEGPGHEEDQRGEPFVGAAGRLLTKIIEAMNFTREQVYICNIIKCRPPGNRNPMLEEIKACSPFLKRQISSIKPDFICALGAFAAQTLLETNVPISKLKGRFHDYMGIKVLPTYHPAYLLRNPGKKRDVWEDMQKLMKALDV